MPPLPPPSAWSTHTSEREPKEAELTVHGSCPQISGHQVRSKAFPRRNRVMCPNILKLRKKFNEASEMGQFIL